MHFLVHLIQPIIIEKMITRKPKKRSIKKAFGEGVRGIVKLITGKLWDQNPLGVEIAPHTHTAVIHQLAKKTREYFTNSKWAPTQTICPNVTNGINISHAYREGGKERSGTQAHT